MNVVISPVVVSNNCSSTWLISVIIWKSYANSFQILKYLKMSKKKYYSNSTSLTNWLTVNFYQPIKKYFASISSKKINNYFHLSIEIESSNIYRKRNCFNSLIKVWFSFTLIELFLRTVIQSSELGT